MNLDNTYWFHNGKYQKELERLQKNIPSFGPADCLRFEIFRIASKLYYDKYNNGGCNRDVLAKYGQFFYNQMSKIPSINKESLTQFCSLDNSVSVNDVEKIIDKTISICLQKTSKFIDLNASVKNDHLESSELSFGIIWDKVNKIEKDNEENSESQIDCYNCGSHVNEYDTWYDENLDHDVCSECC